MIPAKLYIPTSTLNFNNIMSSESISPASFYANRRFGYKRFEKVAPNNLDNLILLYDKYPIFDINDKELENYPLVIEVDTKSISEDCIQEKKGFFVTTNTIYLNPFTARIIFRTEIERTASLSKAYPMIETKLIPLYQGQFVVLSDEIETFDWQPINIDDSSDYDNIAVSYDIAVNKLKGLLYGYLLGANETSSKEVVLLKKQVKDLRNVLSAVLASPDGRATSFQKNQLEELYTSINQNFYLLSGVPSRIKEIIAQKIECYNAQTFVEVLQGEGFYEEWCRKQISKYNLHYHQIQPFYSYQTTDKVAELDEYIGNIEKSISVYDVKTKLDMSKMPIVQNSHIVDVPEQKELLSILFNEYMNEVWNGTEFLSSRYDFAKVGGKLFREKLGENWENSPARAYINSLLKNLNEYTEFDINSTDSLILKSFAAFCQKGESDIDKLRDYLISNGINDFRVAFALWGLFFGFAEMPKTLTNDLFENEDKQYVSDSYKFIHKQLHGIELNGILDTAPKKEERHGGVWNGIKNIEEKVMDSSSGKSVVQSNEANNPLVLEKNEHRTTSIPEALKVVFDSEPFKEIPLEGQQYYIKESLSLFHGKVDKAYIDSLKKIEYPKTKGKWQNAVKVLTQKQKKEKQIPNPSLFSYEEIQPSNQFFFLDKVAFDFLLPLLPNDKKIRKQFQVDLKWFQDNYQEFYYDDKRGRVKGIYFDYPKDNMNVIANFERVLNGKLNNPKAKWLNEIYRKIDINEVIIKLKELYR